MVWNTKVRRAISGGALCASLITALAILPPHAVHAQAEAVADTKADTLLKQAAEQLQKSDGFTTDYESITEYAGPYKDLRETGTLSLARPNLLRIETDRFRRIRSDSPWEGTGNGSTVVSDGKTVWQLTRHPQSAQYRTQPTSSGSVAKALDAFPTVSGFFAASDVPTTGKYLGQKAVEGETFDQVEIETLTEKRVLSFDAKGIFRQVEITPLKEGEKGGFLRRIVRIQPWKSVPANQFAYTPPIDATLVASTGRRSDGLLSIGSVAPDFVAEDANGKPVHLSDFAGKVVLLKFWATWCWPCRQSLPETEQVAREYGNQDVVVLAVAMWDSRKAFVTWNNQYQKSHATVPNPTLHFAYDPQPLGKDVASTLFGVSATPTEFVVGRDGRITATFAGYTGPSDREKVAVRQALALPVAQASR